MIQDKQSRLGKASFVGGKIPRGADSVATAPSAPRSGPLAATLWGGLRPGSLRVHDPRKEGGHGSRLGFPGRRQPRGPAASVNVARGLQALLPWREPGRPQTSFRLPRNALPSPALPVQKKGNGHPARHHDQPHEEEGAGQEARKDEDEGDPDEGGHREEGISPPEEAQGVVVG